MISNFLIAKIIHLQKNESLLQTLSRSGTRTCTNVIHGLLFLLFFQYAHRVTAQPDWTNVKAKMIVNAPLIGNEYALVIAHADSLLLVLENSGFTIKSQVPIASSSKWLTAVLLYKLAEEGKISLDDPVERYLPDFGKYFKGYITIRHCLSHMTGLEDKGTWKTLMQRKKFSSLEEEVNEIVSYKIRAKPGTDFWYGAVGPAIAGRVAEVATKKKFDVLIRTKVLIPLGMRKTTFTELGGGPVNPGGGALSTAEDLIKFLQMLLNKGKLSSGVSFLSEAYVDELLQTQAHPQQVVFAPPAAKGYGYAAGAWVIESQQEHATALASPGLFGCWPMIDRCRGYAYVVMVKNRLGEDRAEIHKEMKDLIDLQLKSSCK